MNKNDIFRVLRQRYDKLEKEGYEVLFIALQGSQNYKQDLYTDEYKSDIDCMAVVLPTIAEIICSKQGVSTTQVLENNEHINIKDIRNMFSLFEKQNVQFIEILFTEYRIINPKYKKQLEELFNLNEDIASMNRQLMYRGIVGMSMEKYNSLYRIYPGTVEKIEKYGYDGKQLHHIIRLNQFIHNLDGGMSFKDSLTYFEPQISDMLLKAKLSRYTLPVVEMYAKTFVEDTYMLKDKLPKMESDPILIEKLNDIKRSCIEQYFREILSKTDIEQNKEIDPNDYENVFITSDLHFGHNNILDFEERNIKLGVETIEEHDNKLIENWNNTVNENDLVYVLGDFSFSKCDRTQDILKQLNGDKILIEGNHDCIYLTKHFDRTLYKEIYDYKEIEYKKQRICLMHYPIQRFKHQDKDVNGYVHLFGHIHSVPVTIPRRSYNVGVDVNDFKPIRLEDAIQKALDNKTGGKINGTM